MRWLIRGALVLLLVAVAAVAVLLLIPAERIAALAAERFEAATGRALVIAGPVEATLWPRIGVRAEGIAVADADWTGRDAMLTADAMEVGIALSSVWGGEIAIETLEVDGAALVLERRADGLGNWVLEGADAAAAAPAPSGDASSGRGLRIDRAVLTGADITWIDAVTGREAMLSAVALETRFDGLDAPLRLDASGFLDGEAVTLAATAQALRPLLEGALTPVTVALAAGATNLELNGRVDLDPVAWEGRIALASTDGFAAARALGLAPPDLPEGLGARAVSLAADMTLTPDGTVHLRDAALDLDGNRITGDIDLDPSGPRPRLSANLAADGLDLAALGGGASVEADARPAGWTEDRIDVSGLFAVDGEVTFASGPIAFGDATIDELRLRAAVEDGRAVIALQPLLAYGGTVTGDLVVNGRGGLSARATLDMSGMRMQPLLTAFADFDRLAGEADLTVDLLGVGDTEAALMRSLDGTVSLRVGAGELLGLDIAGMVRTLDLGFRGEGSRTVFDGLSASFAIADGVARGDDLALAAPYLDATGAGEADIGARTVSYRLIPTVRAAEGGAGITVPLTIEGPWDDPRIRPDLEYLARQRLETERDALEARAGDAARAKLAQELEVAPEALATREGVEDAIRDRVEDKLRGLLFDR